MLKATLRTLSWLLPAMLVFSTNAAEVAPPPDWHTSMMHQAWTRRDEAPTAVYGMTQDARGMLWFAATDGVHRFDGVRFERLTAIDGNKLRSSNTNAVLAVGNALWVGYSFGGVSVFDNGKVRHYGAEDGVSIRTVYKLARTSNGTMWLSTSEGLYWLDGQRWRHVTPADGLPAGNIHYFTNLPDGGILADHPDGVYRSAPGSHQFRKVAGGKEMEIHQLLPNGNALLVTRRQRQFFRYSPQTNALTPLVLPPGDRSADPFLDGRGALWINTDAGLTLARPGQRSLRPFTGLNNLSGKEVYSAMDDREGNLWLTTENGIDRIRESRLTTIALPENMQRALSVQADRDGTVWIGNHKTNGDYEIGTFGVRADGSRVAAPVRNITATLRAPDGSAWFANGEALWRVSAGRWRTWPLPPGLRGNDVQAMTLDGQGRLWVSVVHNGVHVLRNGQWQAGGGYPVLAERTPVSLHADPQGRVWFGYPANRMAVLDGERLHDFGPEDGLGVGNVAVIASHAGRVWAAGDQGVALLQGQRFAAVQDAAGQPLGGAAGMLFTSGGELWLHGGNGLTRITGPDLAAGLHAGLHFRTDRFDYLDGHEGKPSQTRPLSSLAEAADGRIWYATSASVGWIDPAHIARNPQAPTAQVTALRTDQRRYDAQPGLALPQHTTNLEVDFTAAILSIPERVRFRYRLLGQEQAWREAGARRAAIYTNLGPGNYQFEVLAANEDGVWSVAPAVLAFRIEPAFTQTLWFKLLCGALLLALAGLLYWWRLAAVTARISDRLRERLRERERIARTLHDHFLQSVQALMMQFDLIKHGLPSGHALQQRIDAVLETADDVLSEGREQVLALRLNHELTGDLEAALSGLGHILAPRHGARFVLTVTGTPKPLRAAAAAEAYAIGREALLNAFRHARSHEVMVELRHTRAQFVLNVRDDGRGMRADVYARGHRPGHFGLTGMRERAQDAGGTLEICSQAGHGTTVTLRLPARRAYARKAADKLPSTPS
jgi:signal transduction histidine kinase/ligand-binding sensor domain-containing protein